MSAAPVLAADGGLERRVFWRSVLARLGCAAGAFTVAGAVVLVLSREGLSGWMRDTPLAVALAAASLGAAWLARWWADVEAPAPSVALGLHAAVQGAVLAPLGWVALAWFSGWAMVPVGVGVLSMLLAAVRVWRTEGASQSQHRALALSAAPAEVAWWLWGLVRAALVCRD